ncbi:type A chloramphenicol O-acetyltransferase [Paenibacillus azoreducens]|uniref:type A chloramphenicol O-acetyltransferase n=1 Tax=Paenibacillus azoreducens TaxID=116718 RepID=UPI0039F5A6F2
MEFHWIDIESWKRKAYFEHYLGQSKCTFSMTANLNVTVLLSQLRQKHVKLYPAFLYMISRVINSHEEFRTDFHGGKLGYWEQMNPCYTIFHRDDQTFSAIWTEFNEYFPLFYEHYLQDQQQYQAQKGLFVKEMPANTFSVSSIPWVSFTGFNLNIYNEGEYLLPIITGGKYYQDGDHILLPVSLQMHHAVCDGYHAAVFMSELQELADTCGDWLGQ